MCNRAVEIGLTEIVFTEHYDTDPADEGHGFYDYENMDLRTDNPQVLENIPDLNTAFPRIGLREDEYRSEVPSRAAVGGLYNRGKGGDPWDEDQFVD